MKWQGKTGLIWFTGVVEDRNDPLFLNRVRVRIYGVHTHEKQLIATPDLPWSQVLMPVTSPSLSGLGTTTHGLVEGSTVMGFWRDGLTMQDPVIMGSFIGQPQKYSRKIISTDGEEEIERTPSEGFNDPRLATEASYKKTPDGPGPQHMSNRSYGLTLSLDKSPRDQGSDSAINYPRESYIGTSDVNKLARAVVVEEVIGIDAVDAVLLGDGSVLQAAREAVEAVAGVDAYDKSVWPNSFIEDGGLGKTLFSGKETKGDDEDRSKWVAPKYPFNHVYESESGHVIEIDDTPGYERINLFHRSGARIEINNKGEIHIVAAEGQDLNLQATNVAIQGGESVTVSAESEVNILAKGNCTLTSKGPLTAFAEGMAKYFSMKETRVLSLEKIKLG